MKMLMKPLPVDGQYSVCSAAIPTVAVGSIRRSSVLYSYPGSDKTTRAENPEVP